MLILESRKVSRARVFARRLRWPALLALGALVVWAWPRRGIVLEPYHHWKQMRALKQAREFMAEHDPADAQMALQVAFAAMPNGIEAYRLAADMLEQGGSPQAVRLRHHLVEMPDATADDKAALVLSAIRFRDYNSARDALASMTPEEASEPPALSAALAYALNTENSPVADALFDRMRRLYPKNDDFRVAQDVLHLRHPRKEVAERARHDLEELAGRPEYALAVRRQLLSDAIVRRDLAGARRWSNLVVADPRSTLADRLIQANFLLITDKQPFEKVFEQLAPSASATPEDAAQFVRWLLVQRRTTEAAAWIDRLPAPIRSQPVLVSAQAEAFAQARDWDRLEPILEAGAWGRVSRETVRLAMAARLVGNRGETALRLQIWKQAELSAQHSLAGLNVLERLAGLWRWDPEVEDTMWTIVRTFPDQKWVEQLLFDFYHGRGDTANMRAVMALMRDHDGSVPRYQHDWALLTLLLEPTPAWTPAKDVLKQLYGRDGSDPSYATSYAFALAQSGQAADALAVVRKLSPQDRQYPARLPYLAYVYGVNRQEDEVDRLEAAGRNTAFLPEEKRLFLEARVAAERKPPPLSARPGSSAKPLSGRKS